MGTSFPELPEWEFSAVEVSPGTSRVRAIRSGGVSGEATGGNYDALLDDLKEWALRTERDLEQRDP